MKTSPEHSGAPDVASDRLNKIAAEVVIHAKGREPVGGEFLEWWYCGGGLSLPAIRQEDGGIIYFGPAWVSMEITGDDAKPLILDA